MVATSGRIGAISVGAVPMVSMTEWNLDITLNTEALDYFGENGWRSRMYSLSSWSASSEGFLDLHDVTNTGQQDLMNNILWLDADRTPNNITLDLYTDETNVKHYQGTAVPKSMKISCDVSGVTKVSFDFDGSGRVQWLTS